MQRLLRSVLGREGRDVAGSLSNVEDLLAAAISPPEPRRVCPPSSQADTALGAEPSRGGSGAQPSLSGAAWDPSGVTLKSGECYPGDSASPEGHEALRQPGGPRADPQSTEQSAAQPVRAGRAEAPRPAGRLGPPGSGPPAPVPEDSGLARPQATCELLQEPRDRQSHREGTLLGAATQTGTRVSR